MIPQITELTNNNYKETIEGNSMVLVDIYTPWCTSCKTLSPIVDEISYIYKDSITTGKIDAEANQESILDTNTRNVPTLLLYKNGEIVDRLVGIVTKEKLTEFIDKYL